MATSPLFGWEEPDDVDLVKDGAAAIRTLGNAIDTSMGDLLGGTTGQVLSKASNTNMDFTWVTSDDANAIQNTIVDAKGDLIAASAADTPARLAVGNNGETLVADSSTATGLRYQGTQAAGKNYIINGGQEIWQRGTSFASTSVPYCSDRWQLYSSTAPATASRQGASSTGYYARVGRNSGSALGGTIYYGTSLESQSTVPLIGKTVTMSFSARAGANYSAASNALFPFIVYGTGTDQNLFSGLTGQTTVATSTVTLTTSWQRFSVTGTVSASATQLAAYASYVPTGTAGANDYFEIDDVQLELGSVATTFTPAGGTIQGELAACQRYYYRTSFSGGAALSLFGTGVSSTTFQVPVQYPVNMRTVPTAIDYGGGFRVVDGTSAVNLTSPTLSLANSTASNTNLNANGATGLTQYRPYALSDAGAGNAYYGISAEL